MRNLSKAERRELIEAIDGILDLLFVPISKSANDEIAQVEKRISDLMIAEWDETTQAAIKRAAAAISTGPGDRPTRKEIETLLQILAQELGPGLINNTPKQVTELVGLAYIIGKRGVSSEIGARMTLSLEDERAQQILKQHHVFWIGNYYDAELGARIADIARTVALESGLGRKEVGRMLQEALGQEFQRSEHYWRLLGAATVHRARNLGGVTALIEAGVSEYEIMSVLDERTSDICRAMDGKVFRVSHARKLRDAILNAQTPEEIKSIAPWHTARLTPDGYEIRANGSSEWVNINKLSPDQLAKRGLALPPYHGFCRTTYVVRSFEDTWSESLEPFPIEFVPVEQPKWGIPPVSQLSYLKDGKNLGGAGPKSIYVDKKGNEYLFKPAVSKSGAPEDFRAYIQEAAAEIQKLVYGGDDYIPVKSVRLDGKFGVIQPIIKNKGNLKAAQANLSQLPQEYIDRIQTEHVIDWLISNHDAHGGQFLVTESKIFGIDKEQAFRYFPDDRLDWNYHPNKVYGEQEPIYNTLMKDFIAGKVDLNLNHVLPVIQRIEKIPDEEYRKLLTPYAEARFKSKTEREAFLDRAVARKRNIRKDFEDLYSRALSQKLGKKYVFKFADEMPAEDFLKSPLAVQSLSVSDLRKMNSKALKELGKAHKIAYFQQMTKDELIEALAYPERAAQISAMVKERTRQRAARALSEGKKKPEKKEPTTAKVTASKTVSQQEQAEAKEIIDQALREMNLQGDGLEFVIIKDYTEAPEEMGFNPTTFGAWNPKDDKIYIVAEALKQPRREISFQFVRDYNKRAMDDGENAIMNVGMVRERDADGKRVTYYDHKSLIKHEIGHFLFEKKHRERYEKALEEAFGSWKEGVYWAREHVSNYAGTNASEAIMEMFALYLKPDYQKGYLPKPIEKLFEEVLAEQNKAPDPFEDLDAISEAIREKKFGYGLQKDSVLVEGQHVQVRKVFNGKTDEYQITFKLLPENIGKLEGTMIKMGARLEHDRSFSSGVYDERGKLVVDFGAVANVVSRNLRLTMPDGTKVVLWNDKQAKAYLGRVEITVDGYDGKKGAKQLVENLKKLGLDAIVKDPSPEDEKLLKLARLLNQHAPQLMPAIRPEDRTIERLSEILRKQGVDPDQVDNWTKKEVWPGYWTFIDERGAKEMIEAGADHLFAGVANEDGIVGILKTGGLMSTTERFKNGIIRHGASSMTDISTGGAESVFTRLVTRNQKGKGIRYDSSFSGGPYTIIIKPEVLARTDWYAHDRDRYGDYDDYKFRQGRKELVERLMAEWLPNNEVMFRHGITVDNFEKIVVSYEYKRESLIRRLKAEGIETVNGKPIEEFIVYGGVIE